MKLSLILLGFFGPALAAIAQSPGTFVAAGNMTIARTGHTAALLADGRVLIAGGSGVSAELYDPSTGRFTATGSMNSAREFCTATLLKDGRVLIAGGQDGNRLPGSAELYDPSTGMFKATGNLNTPQSRHAATLLGNGKVLIVGGWSGPGATATAELYDPETGTFAIAGTTPGAFGNTATLLHGGRVLIAGGRRAELYDPGTGAFSPSGALTTYPHAMYWHTATLLTNGKVLVAGGSGDGEHVVAHAEIYDPVTGTFAATGKLNIARASHTGTMLPGGRILIAGGFTDHAFSVVESAEIYDFLAGRLVAAGNMTTGRYNHTSTLLTDGTVLIAGGTSIIAPGTIASAEIYFPPLLPVSSASLSAPLAPESLASLFGARLASVSASADLPSLPTSLGGISLRIRDSAGVERLARLLYVSPSQINFEVPAGTAPGDATLGLVNAPATLPPVMAPIRNLAPGLFTFENNMAAAYAVRIAPNETQTVVPPGTAITLGDRPVYLILYATGIRNRSSLNNVQATIGGAGVPVTYAGSAGDGVPGLDQVNIRLTTALNGNTDGRLVLTVDGVASNTVLVDVRLGYGGDTDPRLPPVISGIVNAATRTAGISPGATVEIYGTNMAVSTCGVDAQPWLMQLPCSPTRVTLSGSDGEHQISGDAPISYVSPLQINAQIPPWFAPGSVGVTVVRGGARSNTVVLMLVR